MKKGTYKSGKPGKLLNNQFSGYNNFSSNKKGRINSFVAMDATDMIISDGGGGGVIQNIPHFDDPTPVFIDPVISDPVGIRTLIDNDGTTRYTPATVLYMGTSSPTIAIDSAAPPVDDTDSGIDSEGIDADLASVITPDGNPPANGSEFVASIGKGNIAAIIVIVIIVAIAGYFYFKKSA